MMARMVVELTNRCNLSCGHCFDERHAATHDLSMSVLDSVLREGHNCGISQLSFTGGEPTIHRQFSDVVRLVSDAGYTFSFVSNGKTFPDIYPLLQTYRSAFHGTTFSLDGAREDTHDRLRGDGSFRRVMQAASICVVKDLPFTLNMVLTTQNRREITTMVELATQLGSRAIRFGHLMFTPGTISEGLVLSPLERREVESEIWELKRNSDIPIGMAPGYYSESPLFACGPLELEEYNLDYRGNLTLCCQLSGFSGINSGDDVMGNLHEIGLQEACERFRQRVRIYVADKQVRVKEGTLTDVDHFPCWYCVKYLGKVSSPDAFVPSAWLSRQHSPERRSINVYIESPCSPTP